MLTREGSLKDSKILGVSVEALPRERQLVLRAMRADGVPLRSSDEPFDVPALLDFASVNLVEPIVAKWLLDGEVELSSDVELRCKAVYGASLDRMSTMLSELDLAAEALDAADIPVVGLKNAGIARGIFPDPGLCPMGDVDVLVKKSQFREAHEVIESCGFELATRSTVEEADLEEGLIGGGTEYIKRVNGEEVWFELQWRPIAGRWIRTDQEPDGAELIDRSVRIEGTKLRLLEPTDNMMQVCLHTAKHSYFRAPGLRLHTDVDRLAYYAPPDWDAFVEMARRMDVTHSVFFSLALAHELLESRVPERVLAELRPPAWKLGIMTKWFERADLFYPDEKKFSRPEMMAFHAMLYDDFRGLSASVLGVEPDEMSLSGAPDLARSGYTRMKDIVTRYQR